MTETELNNLSFRIIGAAMEVHSYLGPGLLESIYQEALMHELSLRGIKAKKEVALPVFYKGNLLNGKLRLDILVEDEIILELKSVDEERRRLFFKQLSTYLKVADKRLGLLINFNCLSLQNGITRVVNDL